ncbi:MAG: UDP-4-amino-4,6-dideoxy-N-acetyl-beta-L-altrosamine transaminase [Gammaproteobacteria bacterium]|nr:UDP-4-amino-4,6-dideoxy-N-acetyl-beta-L-altrosamine transaminase [Chloroflexota bacterium]MBM4199664.1 UDP-4-amino-4,6-dideoxy-N-acetyl-beta-L-altrosamine transaminase [Gammaproteobacteria bacterium]
MSFIPYGRQVIGDEDIAAVSEVLRSDWLTQGPAVERFEQAVAQYCGAAHAVAVNSATSALHLACLALGVGPGDLGWTTPNTFVASANCLLYCGASVDFVDIDPVTRNMDVAALESKLIRARDAGRLPKVVIPVHFAGHPCDMAGIRRLADAYGFKVVEDASHAVGACYRGRPVGSCEHADLAVFSFHPVKIMTTGEGGMLLGNDAALMRRVALLRSHGITRDPAEMEGESEGGWYYQQIGLGYNYRMTDIQAALGASQLARVGAFVARRRELAARYGEMLADLPLRLPAQDRDSAWHLYVVGLAERSLRRRVYDAMRAAGIGVNVHYIPAHLQPWYRRLGFQPGDFPVAEAHYAGALTLPLYPGLSELDQERVVRVLRQALT